MTDIAALGLRIEGVEGITQAASALDRLSTSARNAESSGSALGSSSKKASSGIRAAGDASEKTAKEFDNMAKAGIAAATAIVAGFATSKIVHAVDQWSSLNAQLKIATGNSQAAAAAYQDVLTVAMKTGQGLEEVGTIYRRLADNAAALGVSSQQVANVTETIAKSMAVSGVSAEASRAALMQFGQALASGALRGEEFNSVMEQAPRLARALADGLNVPIGQLRKLAEAGAITSDTIIQALESQNGRIADEFGKMPVTMGRAVTNLKTQFTDLVGSVEKNSGVFGWLASGVDALAKNLDTVAAAVGVVGAVMVGKAAAGLAGFVAGQIAAQAATQKLAAAELQAAEIEAARAASMIRSAAVYGTTAAQTEALTLATNRLNAAQAGAAAAGVGVGVAARAGSAAIGMLGGPIGIVTTLLTLGATAWMVWGDKAKNATKEAAKDAAENIDAILLKLGDLNGRIEETSRKSYDGTIKAAEAEIKPLQAKIADMKSQAAALETGLGKNVGQSKSYQDLQVSISALTKREIELQSELGLARSQSFAVGTAALNRFIDANAVGAEKVRVTQEKLSKEFAAAIANTGGVFDESNIQHQRALKALRAGLADAEKKDKKTEPGELKKIVENLQERLAVLNAQAGATEKLTQTEKEYQALLKSKPAIAGNATVKALADQAIAAEKLAAATAAAKKEEEAYQKLKEQSISALASELKNVADQVDAQRKHNEEIGLTTEALAQLEQRRLDDAIATQEQAFAQAQKEGADLVELKLIDDKIAALRNLKSLKAEGAARQVVTDEAKRAADDWKKFSDDIERSLTDSLMRSFESGENFGKTFVKSLQNTLKTTVLKVAVQAVVGDVMGAVGLGSGAGGGSGSIGSMLSMGSNLSTLAGGGSILSGFGTGFSSMAGEMAMGANFVGPSVSLASGSVGAGAATASAMGSTAAGAMASVAAAAPYVLAAIAIADAVGAFGKRGGPQQGQYGRLDASGYKSSFTMSGGDALNNPQLASAAYAQAQALFAIAGKNVADLAIEQGYKLDPQGSSAGLAYRNLILGGKTLTGGTFDGNNGAQWRGGKDDAAGAAGYLAKITGAEIEALANAIDDSKLNTIIASLKANFGDLAVGIQRYMTAQAVQKDLLAAMMTSDEAEKRKLADANTLLADNFRQIGKDVPTTTAGFRALIEGLDLTTKSGQDALVALGGTKDAFLLVAEAAKRAEEQHREWSDKLAVLQGTTTEQRLAREKEMASITDLATQAIAKQVYALQDQAEATERAAEATERAAAAAARHASVVNGALDAYGGMLTVTGDEKGALELAVSRANDAYDAAMRTLADEIGVSTARIGEYINEKGSVQAAVKAFWDEIGESNLSNADAIREKLTAFVSAYTGTLNASKALSEYAPKVTEPVVAIVDDMLAKIAEMRAKWQDKLDVLSGTTTQRAIELRDALASTTDAATQAIIRQVFALEDQKEANDRAVAAAKTGVDEAMSAVQRAVDAQKKVAQAAIDAANEQIAASKAVFDAASRGIDQLLGKVGGMTAAQGRQFISSAVGTLASTGYLPDASKLQDAISAAVGGMDSKNYGSAFDLERARRQTAADLSRIRDASGDQLSVAEQALQVARDQVARLDSQLELARAQVDALNNVNNSVLSLDVALTNLATAIAAARSVTPPVVTGGGGGGGGGGTGATGTTGASGSSGSGFQFSVYQGNAVKTAAAAFYADASGSAISQAAFDAALAPFGTVANALAQIGITPTGGQEGIKSQLKQIYGFADGGRHKGGLRLVGESGPELEVTGPSRIYNSRDTLSMLRSNNGNEEMAAELRALREENRAQARAMVTLQARLTRLMERWDGDGMPEQRVVA